VRPKGFSLLAAASNNESLSLKAKPTDLSINARNVNKGVYFGGVLIFSVGGTKKPFFARLWVLVPVYAFAVKMFSLHTLAHLAVLQSHIHTLSARRTLLPLLFFAAAHTCHDKNYARYKHVFFRFWP
jgi:hypothetical protein